MWIDNGDPNASKEYGLSESRWNQGLHNFLASHGQLQPSSQEPSSRGEG